MLARLWRILLLLFARPRVEHLEHPHGALAFAGQRTALVVRARGHGRLGEGPLARDVEGAYAGVLFVEVPPQTGRVAVSVYIRALLFRHSRSILLDVLPGPGEAPPAPAPAAPPALRLPDCVPALPRFEVSVEVPRP